MIATILVGRILYIQTIKYNHYRSKAKDQLLKLITIYPHRGNIYDRHKVPLTITKAHYSLYAVPKNIKDKKKVSKQLSKVIGTNWGSIYKKINKKASFCLG